MSNVSYDPVSFGETTGFHGDSQGIQGTPLGWFREAPLRQLALGLTYDVSGALASKYKWSLLECTQLHHL